MAAKPSLDSMMRRAGLPALALVVIGFFGGYALLGPNGVLAYGEYKRQLAQRNIEFARLEHDRAELRNRVRLLDPARANPDMVDELVRRQLGVAHPDEVIIPLD